jgi:hypothetical protein
MACTVGSTVVGMQTFVQLVPCCACDCAKVSHIHQKLSTESKMLFVTVEPNGLLAKALDAPSKPAEPYPCIAQLVVK